MSAPYARGREEGALSIFAVRIVGITIETECPRCGRSLRLTVPPEDLGVIHGEGVLCGGCGRGNDTRPGTPCSTSASQP
jgi:hypothetical protein